jgi:DHA1 family tetracycline resistance protein-like MFS transporter
MTEATAAPAASKAAVTFIFITLTLDVLAMGVIIPVWPKLIEGFIGATNQSDAVRIGSWLGFVWAFMQFAFMPVQGALSDHFGRRPVLLLSMTGLGLDYIVMALAPNLWWLFVGRAISGLTAASFSTANAYIADITPPDKRAAAFGLMGAAFGIGFVLGPLLGGQAGTIDPRLPFWIAAALSLLNALYGYFILPESLPPERRSKFSLKNANPFGAFRLLMSNARLTGLAAGQFLYMVGHNIYPAVFVWFAMYRYGWNEAMIGWALALVGATSIVVQGGMVGPVVKALGERRSMIVGLLFGIVAFLIYGFGDTGFWVWVAIPIAALWGFYAPAAQTLMTQTVSPSEQGRLQGALGSLMGIAMIIAPILYPQVFAAAIDAKRLAPGWPLLGAPFFVAAALLIAALAVVIPATRPKT